MDKHLTFVLGAQDPEMREIEKSVARAGASFVHAARDGVRVWPRNAYEANGVVLAGPGGVRAALLPPQAPAVFVECNVVGVEPVLRVDHHNPGDAGYDKSPERYMEGSSLGQVLRVVEIEPDDT